jgi:hypothetical protein
MRVVGKFRRMEKMKANRRIISCENHDIIEISVNSTNILTEKDIERIKYTIENYLEMNFTVFHSKTGIYFNQKPTDVSAIIVLNKSQFGSPLFEEFEMPLLTIM